MLNIQLCFEPYSQVHPQIITNNHRPFPYHDTIHIRRPSGAGTQHIIVFPSSPPEKFNKGWISILQNENLLLHWKTFCFGRNIFCISHKMYERSEYKKCWWWYPSISINDEMKILCIWNGGPFSISWTVQGIQRKGHTQDDVYSITGYA